MRIGSTVAGYNLASGIMQSTTEQDTYYAVGGKPGNKRPEYAVLKLVGHLAGHGSYVTPLAVYSSHEMKATERRNAAMADAMRQSGWASVLLDSMAMA